jgi:hypothetical protein
MVCPGGICQTLILKCNFYLRVTNPNDSSRKKEKSWDVNLLSPHVLRDAAQSRVDEYEMINLLKKAGSVQQLNITINMKSFLINDFKVDLVNDPYEWLSPCEFEDTIRLAGTDDIAPVKLTWGKKQLLTNRDKFTEERPTSPGPSSSIPALPDHRSGQLAPAEGPGASPR